ncbi:MAG: diaminopimelate epimerase [Acidobacteria bacterium]|nr:diaminopimelate epimerase [Acidobacteriota bacterium]
MHFSKLEGLGNDFLVANAESVDHGRASELAQKICDRHYGVGADGLLVYSKENPSSGSDFRMRIFNADGGEAELSGNGLRCLAAFLFAERLAESPTVRIATLAGVKLLRLTDSIPPEYWFEVDMGEPILERSRIAFTPSTEPASLISFELSVGAKAYLATISSMGNPHCSLFVNQFSDLDWEGLGSQIERHPFFPRRTNVEFIRVRNRSEIEVRFWERGVGKTFSSGTGSCAATVASILNGHTDRRVKIQTLGGSLEVEWKEDKRLQLNGPARSICSGEYVGWTPPRV